MDRALTPRRCPEDSDLLQRLEALRATLSPPKHAEQPSDEDMLTRVHTLRGGVAPRPSPPAGFLPPRVAGTAAPPLAPTDARLRGLFNACAGGGVGSCAPSDDVDLLLAQATDAVRLAGDRVAQDSTSEAALARLADAREPC